MHKVREEEGHCTVHPSLLVTTSGMICGAFTRLRLQLGATFTCWVASLTMERESAGSKLTVGLGQGKLSTFT